jgi:putative selenium metabolism hydrolase
VPDLVRLYIDRRLTFGESAEQAIAQVCALVPAHQLQSGEVTVEMMKYAEPSYTGFVFPVDKYFPAWALDEDHPLVQAGHEAARLIGLPDHPSGKWNFSTNGTYWMGKAGIPSIGFGPGEEETAHTVMDSVLLSDVVKAAEFYAVLPALIP